MICRIFYLFLLTLSLTACAFQKPARTAAAEALINRNAELIEQQQAVLAEQSAKLDDLTVIQQELSMTLEYVRETLLQVQELATYDAVGVPVPSKILQTLPVVERGSANDEEDENPAPQVIRNGVEKTILGRNEWVGLDVINQVLEARIDTGVLLSSISAENVQPFERNGEKWVSFSLAGDESGTRYETPLVRYAKARSDKQDRLAVINLTVHLGDLIEETEFALADKDNAVYPVLLGRAFLRDIALVDVSRKFIFPKKQLTGRIQANQTVQQ